MDKKKSEEMTFREFFDLAKNEETKEKILVFLREKGFTEKQVNEMKMKEVFNLLQDVFIQYKTLIDVSLKKMREEQKKEAPSKSIKPVDFESMLKEMKGLKDKYSLPKGMLFVPDKLEISLQRISYDNFHLSYKEFFNYIPDLLLDVVITTSINALVQMGMPRKWITQIDRNGVGIEADGNFRLIASCILPELLIQKRLEEAEISSFLSLVARSRKAFTDFFELEFEWNSETEEKFQDNLDNSIRVMQEHPSIVKEMEAIVKKYTQPSENLDKK